MLVKKDSEDYAGVFYMLTEIKETETGDLYIPDDIAQAIGLLDNGDDDEDSDDDASYKFGNGEWSDEGEDGDDFWEPNPKKVKTEP